jgi:hypothetical protein
MNSKQLNFFLVPEDLPLVYDFFNKQDIKYVRIPKEDAQDMSLESLPFRDGTAYEQRWFTIEDFRSHVFLKPNTHVPGFYVDIDKSYVLQFTPGGFYPGNSKVLKRGRFYCPTSYFVSNGESVAKSDEFKSWVDKVFRLFKKEFLTRAGDQKWIYFSHRTLKWMEDTGAVVDTPYLKITLP